MISKRGCEFIKLRKEDKIIISISTKQGYTSTRSPCYFLCEARSGFQISNTHVLVCRHDGRDETVWAWHGKSITPGHQNHPRPSQPRRPPRNPGPPCWQLQRQAWLRRSRLPVPAQELASCPSAGASEGTQGCVAALQHCRPLQLEHRVCDGAKVLFVWIQRVSTDQVIQRYSNIKKTSECVIPVRPEVLGDSTHFCRPNRVPRTKNSSYFP